MKSPLTVQPLIYFDNAATTALLPEALDCLAETSRFIYGNSSSAHLVGKRSSAVLEKARAVFSEIFSVPDDHIVFTSGGTESNNLAAWGALGGITNAFHWLASPQCREEQLLTTVVEHPATQKLFEQFDLMGANLAWARVASDCILDAQNLAKALGEKRVRFASIHHAHNEIGAVQPLAEISRQIREHSPEALIHADAVQSFSKLEVDLEKMGVDLVSLSAHKTGGPKGIGALILGKRFIDRHPKLGSFLIGSSQQNGLRPGTVPVPLIASFAVAAKHALNRLQETRRTLLQLRTLLSNHLPATAQVNGPVDLSESNPLRAPQTLNFSLTGVSSAAAVERLSSRGFCLSAGAACKTGKTEGSEVLLRMGLSPERASSSLRVSFAPDNTLEEVSQFTRALRELL